MKPRNQYTPKEREARSRLAQLLHNQDVVVGSLVAMARKCGKAGCHCEQGEKHVSLYLSTKVGGKRRMVYIPTELEEEVRRFVAAYQEAGRLMDVVSGACMDRLEARKREGKHNG